MNHCAEELTKQVLKPKPDAEEQLMPDAKVLTDEKKTTDVKPKLLEPTVVLQLDVNHHCFHLYLSAVLLPFLC